MWTRIFFSIPLILFCIVESCRSEDPPEITETPDPEYETGSESEPESGTTVDPLSFNKSATGREVWGNRIIGGSTSKPHFFPSIVLLKINNIPRCAGTIYNNEWIISAAHCCIRDEPSDYTFFAGKHDKTKKEPSEQKVTAVQVIKHEKFEAAIYRNDIALFRITPKLVFNDKVKPIGLPPKNWNKKGNATSVGWGRTEKKKSSDVLKGIALPLVPNTECQKIMGDIVDTNICAGNIKGGEDTCNGDSGGPLYVREKSGLIQIGIISWGDGCAAEGRVGVYTRLSKYIDWIKAKTVHETGKSIGIHMGFNSSAQDALYPIKFPPVDISSGGEVGGFKRISRIVGGVEAQRHEFPAIVLMYHKDKEICAGTIIDKEWVMSASHCLHGPETHPDASHYRFVAGKHDRTQEEEEEEQHVKVSLIIRHKSFPEPFYNDITLFKITPPFQFSETVKPANFPKPYSNPTGTVKVVGWGITKPGVERSSVLGKVVLPLITNDKCRESYGRKAGFPGIFCGGYEAGQMDSCQGDSGAPVYSKQGQELIVIGLTAWGEGCEDPNKPGVYTKVSYYVKWIERETGLQLLSPGGSGNKDGKTCSSC